MTSHSHHAFASYVLDPVPDALWRNMGPIPGTRVGFCDTCGFYHVDPYPPAEALARYYATYEMPTAQANLAETARLLARNITKSDTVLDVGCGDGGFLHEMHKLGFTNLVGFDQSPGLDRAKLLGFGTFYRASVWEFLSQAEREGGTKANAIVMVNVLEHVSDPLDLLRRVHGVLPAGGILCVTVPNDFSPLQRAFLKVKGHLPWFVCLPDHLNYFDFDTLAATLEKSGFAIADRAALYPLELFLLQDLDYIADPALGSVAHRRRVMFEDNMKAAGMTDDLDRFYRTLAAGGYGRDAMMVAVKC
ncbi:MAG: class I SAM-dependent methyltransferase [Burkholderiales bacterium]